MKMNTNQDWLRDKASAEDNCMVSVGGLVSEMVNLWDAAIEIGMARAGNYTANTETEPTSLVFANGTQVSVVNGHLVIDRCLTPAGREILKQIEEK